MKPLLEYTNSYGGSVPKIVDAIIDRVAADLGEEVKKFIGAGALGYAFALKSGRVLKLTKDKNEINLIYNLSKLSSIPKSLMTYYNVGKIPNLSDDDPQFYYILMDQVEPLTEDEESVINGFYKHRIQYQDNYYDEIMNVLEKNIENWYNKWEFYKIKICKGLLPHIRNIVKDLKKHKIKNTDFHSGNLGWNKDGKLIMFDLGGYIEYNKAPADKTHRLKTMKFEKFNPETKNEIWIEQIANELGEKIKGVKGSGSFGTAYETKSGKILKITADPVEIRLAYKLSKNRNWFQYIINYYNVGRTNRRIRNDGTKRNAYWLLMDKVEPIENTDVGRVIDRVYMDLIQYQKDYYKNIINIYNVESAMSDCTENYKKIAREIYPHILNIVKELKKHHIIATDFHSGNIGWANDRTKLVLYDLGGYVDEKPDIKLKNLKNINLADERQKKSKIFDNFITKFEVFEARRSPMPDYQTIKNKLQKYKYNGVHFGDGIVEIDFYSLHRANPTCYYQKYLDILGKLFNNFIVSFYDDKGNFIKANDMWYFWYTKTSMKDNVTVGDGKLQIECYGYDENNPVAPAKTFFVNKHRPVTFYISESEMRDDMKKYNL